MDFSDSDIPYRISLVHFGSHTLILLIVFICETNATERTQVSFGPWVFFILLFWENIFELFQ